jgi:glyoxylase-like metal-dependent hydrolase (beta-lactamase superfamily II)
MDMRYVHSLVLTICAVAWAATASAQPRSPLVGDQAVPVSQHVWAVMGFPNVGIVVGTQGVLVVDTGLGSRNGATIANIVAKLAPKAKLYLTTTHFHPEHASGVGGFPAGTILIRNSVQQKEMDAHGDEMIALFASRSEQQKELLSDVSSRRPDVIFDSEYKLDLGGGVRVRLLWFGGAHTQGDELTFVEPDKTLISGDVVQNKVVPMIPGDGGTPSSWIAVLDKVQALGAQHVLPDHSAPGDGSLVAQEKAFIVDLRTRALQLKRQGVSADQAGEQLTEEYKSRYSDWPITSVAGFVRAIYKE